MVMPGTPGRTDRACPVTVIRTVVAVVPVLLTRRS